MQSLLPSTQHIEQELIFTSHGIVSLEEDVKLPPIHKKRNDDDRSMLQQLQQSQEYNDMRSQSAPLKRMKMYLKY